MNSENSAPRKGRLQLLLVAAIFTVPLVAAVWMYYGGGDLRPEGRTNHGTLLDPVVSLAEELPDSALLDAVRDSWGLVLVVSGECATDCREALYKQRQARLMLGNDMSRVIRVLLHGEQAPDNLFLAREHAGLVAMNDVAARQLLVDARPRNEAPGGYYLVDPLGNLVMYFPADIPPRQLVDDIEHLLKISRIG